MSEDEAPHPADNLPYEDALHAPPKGEHPTRGAKALDVNSVSGNGERWGGTSTTSPQTKPLLTTPRNAIPLRPLPVPKPPPEPKEQREWDPTTVSRLLQPMPRGKHCQSKHLASDMTVVPIEITQGEDVAFHDPKTPARFGVSLVARHWHPAPPPRRSDADKPKPMDAVAKEKLVERLTTVRPPPQPKGLPPAPPQPVLSPREVEKLNDRLYSVQKKKESQYIARMRDREAALRNPMDSASVEDLVTRLTTVRPLNKKEEKPVTVRPCGKDEAFARLHQPQYYRQRAAKCEERYPGLVGEGWAKPGGRPPDMY